MRDLKARISNYEAIYETVDEAERDPRGHSISFIKVYLFASIGCVVALYGLVLASISCMVVLYSFPTCFCYLRCGILFASVSCIKRLNVTPRGIAFTRSRC